MQRLRSAILILGLLVVVSLNLWVGFLRFHKGMGHPVGKTAVAVYKADLDPNTPTVPVRDFINNESVETRQLVNVYLQYSYEDHEILRFTHSVLITIAATFVLYFFTFALAWLLPRRA